MGKRKPSLNIFILYDCKQLFLAKFSELTKSNFKMAKLMGVCVCVCVFFSSSCHSSTVVFGKIARFFDWVLACSHKYERILKVSLPSCPSLEPNLAKFYYAWFASSLATPQIWKKEKPVNYNNYFNLWRRTPTGRLKWKKSRTIFRCKCCTILTDIIITNEKTVAFSCRFLQKKTADIIYLRQFRWNETADI